MRIIIVSLKRVSCIHVTAVYNNVIIRYVYTGGAEGLIVLLLKEVLLKLPRLVEDKEKPI